MVRDCQLEQRDDGLWYCTRPGCNLPPLPRRMARNCAVDRQPAGVASSNLQSSISTRPLVLVLGLHRSLSSCLAECLERLGVFMGRQTEGGECQRLRYILEGVMRFPRCEPIVRCSDRGALRRWLSDHFAAAGERLAGAKYPHLCRLAAEIEAIHPDLKLIHVARPLDDSIESLVARSARATGLHATREECETLQRSLHDSLREFLRDRPHLRVASENLLRFPAREIDRVIEYLGLDPTPDERAAAIEHVEPARGEQ